MTQALYHCVFTICLIMGETGYIECFQSDYRYVIEQKDRLYDRMERWNAASENQFEPERDPAASTSCTKIKSIMINYGAGSENRTRLLR